MGIYTEQDCLERVDDIALSKSAMKASIEGKGVSVPDDAPLSHYPSYIDDIEMIALESKNYNITSNGSTSITPDSGYDGISGGTITVNVPTPTPSLQTKTATVTENGTVTYSADSGYDGISTISVTTDVPLPSVGGDIITVRELGNFANFNEIGWDEESQADFQVNGEVVDWSPLNNSAHTISSANTAIYGVINHSNHRSYVSNSNMEYLPYFETSGVTDAKGYFNSFRQIKGVPKFDTSNMTIMGKDGDISIGMGMFSYCVLLKSVPKFDTSNVTNMGNMFYGCSALKTVPDFDTSNVTNIWGMFQSCDNLVVAPKFDLTKATCTKNMFAMCYALTYVPELNFSASTNTHSMFYSCNNLAKIESINMSSSENAGVMFNQCTSLNSIRFKGSINTDISLEWSPIDDASCKSLLTAASNCTNENMKMLYLKSGRTIQDDASGTYQTMLETCISKGWTIQNLTIIPG